ncbi:MFS transporter [Marinithermofilum abyssi]|jgi:MFS transporter, putative metabolite:H+ symporter|uniref:MFS transporter n=1 Tax=Marinithermofilum abyssi TaxID=1571185 RepID=UPI001664A3AE|nr:MFS transporter [Marinithermofilum abyssi]
MKTGDQVIQDLPWRWNTQGKIFIIGGLGYMFDAWDVGLTGFLLPLLAKDWGLSGFQLGLFGSAGLIGMAVGAVIWGTIADLIGRKRAFTYTLLIFSIFSVLGALSPSYGWLLISRFIAGIGLGGCIPVDYSMVAEFMPRKNRGAVLTALDVWWPIGLTVCGIVSVALLPLQSWRILLLFMVLPALLVFWVRRSVPESPLFLIRRGRDREAREVIQSLVDKTGASVENWTLPLPADSSKTSFKGFFRQFKSIWSFNWKITFTVWSLFVTILLLYYGVITWLPTILVNQGYPAYKAYLFATSMTAIGIAGVLAAAWLVEVVGRKWVIGASGFISSLAMVLFTMQIETPALARIWILVFGFASQVVIPAIYCYAPEVYPTLLRASGFGWASFASRIGASLVPVIFGTWLWPTLGLTNTFSIIGSLVLFSIIIMVFFGPETRGKALDQRESGDWYNNRD